MTDWLAVPNLHPLFVHFPIALLPAAVVFDVISIVLRRRQPKTVDWQGRAALYLYLAATVAAFLALRTGEAAADGFVGLPPEMQPHISAHSDSAHTTAFLLGGVALLHLLLSFVERRRHVAFARLTVLLVALGGVFMVARTADLGGALVYRHGLGVEATTASSDGGEAEPDATGKRRLDPKASREERRANALARMARTENGGLEWRPLQGDGAFLADLVEKGERLPLPRWDDTAVAPDGLATPGLYLRVSGETLLLLPAVYGDVQVDAELRIEDFVGTLGVLHHVRGAEQRGLFAVDNGARQGSLVDLRDGDWTVLDEEPVSIPAGRFTLSVSSSGRHLKGMIDGETAVHGHIAAPEEGRCGLLLDGNGTVMLRLLRVTPI